MKYLIFLSILLSGSVAQAQKITQLSPTNITYRAAGIADTNNAILAGDSATILRIISTNGLPNSQNLLPPFNRTHTVYGVSYFRSDSAIFVADNGLIFTWAAGHWQQRGTGLTNQVLRGITRTADGGFVIVGDSGIVLRSANVGVTWQKIPSFTTQNIYAIAINDSGNGYFVGAHGLIGRTSDYGKSWLDVSDTTNLSQYSESPVALRAITISGDSAIAAGDSSAAGMIRNGAPWTRLPISNQAPFPSAAIAFTAVGWDEHDHEWLFLSDQDVEGNLYGLGDSIINSDNERIGDPDGGTQELIYRFNCIASSPFFPRFIQGGTFESSEDYYRKTVYVSYGYLENFLFASFDHSSKIGYATATDGIFLRTTDGGKSWNALGEYGPGWSGVTTSYAPTDIHTIDANNAFAVGWAGTMFRTSDAGVTWDSTNIDPNHERLHSIANPSDSTYIVCGDYGTILRSTDGANTWKASATSTTAYLESTAFSSHDTGVAVGTYGGILQSTDQGVTWSEINNPLSGTNISYRQVQAFPNGTYYATTDSAGLFRSTDHGVNWASVPFVPQTISEGFYNDKIGVIAESAWSSAIVDDTMRFAFTRDGFATEPTQWTMPIVSNNRMVFHFLDSNTFLCLGSDGFVVKVDMSQTGASVTTLSAVPDSTIRVYPNPSSGEFRVEYATKASGPVQIELWDETGKKVSTLFSGEEGAGAHEQILDMPTTLHDNYLIRLTAGGATSTTKLTIQ